MKLTGDMKNKVDNAENKQEAKDLIEKAGIELNDDELDEVSGGKFIPVHKDPKLS